MFILPIFLLVRTIQILLLSAFEKASFHLALVWVPHIGVITLREQMFFRVATLEIYETAGPLALIKFFIWSVGWLLISIGEAKLIFLFGLSLNWFCHMVLARRREQWQFPRNTKAALPRPKMQVLPTWPAQGSASRPESDWLHLLFCSSYSCISSVAGLLCLNKVPGWISYLPLCTCYLWQTLYLVSSSRTGGPGHFKLGFSGKRDLLNFVPGEGVQRFLAWTTGRFPHPLCHISWDDLQ